MRLTPWEFFWHEIHCEATEQDADHGRHRREHPTRPTRPASNAIDALSHDRDLQCVAPDVNFRCNGTCRSSTTVSLSFSMSLLQPLRRVAACPSLARSIVNRAALRPVPQARGNLLGITLSGCLGY